MARRVSRSKGVAALRAGVMAALLCGAAVVPSFAFAQSSQGTGRQLSADIVEQQVPSAFPEETDGLTQEPESGEESSGQKKSQAESKLVNEETVPPAPEQKKLVPAKAMGVGAQEDQGGGDPVSLLQPDTASEEEPTAMPDILEKYAAKARENGAADQDGDALPAANSEAPPMGKIDDGFAVSTDGGEAQMTPEKKKALKEGIQAEAFDAAMTGVFPLTEDQIAHLLKRYDSIQKATETPPYVLPTPEISMQNIQLDPGVVPPTIKTAVGNVTTLNMLDATGAPWPVQDVTWAGDYEVVEPEEGGHIIRITPMNHFARGNIVIRLLTLKTPLTLTLGTGRDVVQYRVDVRVPEYGPFAAAPLMQGGKSMVAGSSELTSVLDGGMPTGMVKLEVIGVDGRTTAYAMNGTTYVRTPLTLLSPAWKSSISSADGMNVYELSNAPVILLSDGGTFTRATLKEKEDLLDE